MFLFMLCILFAIIFYFIYLFIKTAFVSGRKFRRSVKQKLFYMADDKKNVRKNFFITYKGAVFEGEKYLGNGKNSFDVVSIHIWICNHADTGKLARTDFFFIEQQIRKQYPKATINWNNPFYELMR